VSFENAVTKADYVVMLPDSNLASDDSLAQAWSCDDLGGIALEYKSGVIVYERLNDLKDPEATYRALADAYPEYSVGESHGHVASLADPMKFEGASGGVDFVIDGARYVVAGDGKIPLDQLIIVADSLQPASS
jgi:hypothetical protein